MKRIIRQDGPKSTDRALVAQRLRESNIDILDLTEKEANAIRVTDFHDSEYEYSINHWLSRRSLALLEELAELGIYGEDGAEVGDWFFGGFLHATSTLSRRWSACKKVLTGLCEGQILSNGRKELQGYAIPDLPARPML